MINKKCYIAAAGAGKTTFLVNDIISSHNGAKVGFVTFTVQNQRNAETKIRSRFGYLPSNIKILGWYEFLLRYLVNPYKADIVDCLNTRRISLIFDEDFSRVRKAEDGNYYAKYKQGDKVKKYFTKNWEIHKDLLAEFAWECLKVNKESVAKRLNESFDALYLDECQDFGNHDLDILKHIFKTFTGKVYMATDPRQNIIKTTKFGNKYSGKIDEFINEKVNLKARTYVELDYDTLSYTHRCIKDICDMATQLFEHLPTTECNCQKCRERRQGYAGVKGIYVVPESEIKAFLSSGQSMSIVYSKTEKAPLYGKVLTIGHSKGLEADVVLLYPTKDMLKFFLTNRSIELKDGTRNKLYVAMTRARYLLGIVYRDNVKINT